MVGSSGGSAQLGFIRFVFFGPDGVGVTGTLGRPWAPPWAAVSLPAAGAESVDLPLAGPLARTFRIGRPLLLRQLLRLIGALPRFLPRRQGKLHSLGCGRPVCSRLLRGDGRRGQDVGVAVVAVNVIVRLSTLARLRARHSLGCAHSRRLLALAPSMRPLFLARLHLGLCHRRRRRRRRLSRLLLLLLLGGTIFLNLSSVRRRRRPARLLLLLLLGGTIFPNLSSVNASTRLGRGCHGVTRAV